MTERKKGEPRQPRLSPMTLLLSTLALTACSSQTEVSASRPTPQDTAVKPTATETFIPEPTATMVPTATEMPPTPTITATPEPTATKEKPAVIAARVGKFWAPEQERTYPLMTASMPDNPDYPLVRDRDGKPVLGVIAVDRVSDGWDVPPWRIKNMEHAVVVGRIAGVTKMEEYYWELSVDVPTTDPQRYLRFPVGVIVDKACGGNAHPPLFDLTETIEQASNGGQPLPAPFDFDQQPLQLAPFQTYCQLMQRWLASDLVGVPIGLNLTNPAMAANGEFFEAADIFEQLVAGQVPDSTCPELYLSETGAYLPSQFYTDDFKPVIVP